MTIYAILNGISAGIANEEDTPLYWGIISAAGILQGGNPYFVPDFAGRFEARTALAVRIGRLGKGIAERFAYRYVEAVAPAVLFTATPLLDDLSKHGLPWTRAISYDRCLAMGRFTEIPYEKIRECRIHLTMTDKRMPDIEMTTDSSPNVDIGHIIECLSRDNTLKTGDILLVGIAPEGPEAITGLSARLSLNDGDPMRFNIR